MGLGPARDYSCGIWGTYRQWAELGAQVRKGGKSSLVVFYKDLDIDRVDPDTGETEADTIFIAKPSPVFNADQVDGFILPEQPARRDLTERVDAAEHFVASTGAQILHGGSRAFYRPSTDHIQMPERDRCFGSQTSNPTEAYYSILLHELTHWTAHPSRLDRDLKGRFVKCAYAMEELVAELGAAYLCVDLAIAIEPRKDHADYIADWLGALRMDAKAIFAAAASASHGESAVIPDITGSPMDIGHGPRDVLRVDGGNTSNCRGGLRVTDLRQWAKSGCR